MRDKRTPKDVCGEASHVAHFITLTLVSLLAVHLLTITLHHNIVKVLWIHEHEPQALKNYIETP